MLGFGMGELLLVALSISAVGSCGCLGHLPPDHLLLHTTMIHCHAMHDVKYHDTVVLVESVCLFCMYAAVKKRCRRTEGRRRGERRRRRREEAPTWVAGRRVILHDQICESLHSRKDTSFGAVDVEGICEVSRGVWTALASTTCNKQDSKQQQLCNRSET